MTSVEYAITLLLGDQNFRRYRRRRFSRYLSYIAACVIGLAVGLVAGGFYNWLPESEIKTLFYQNVIYFLISLPALILIYGLAATMMGQIQRMGVKFSTLPPYWLPITWEEHTLSSVLAKLFGFPLLFMILLSSAILVFSIFLEILQLAFLTVLTLFVSAFSASVTTEIFKVLQLRFTSVIYKSSGKIAIWVRFFGFLISLIVFYMIWFNLWSSTNYLVLLEMIIGAQSILWFIPYLWLGIALAYFTNGLLLQSSIFLAASLMFTLLLFLTAVKLNTRFGLYEAPSITVSKVYYPKTGFLRRIGFSSLEAALIRKDFKAFTRRRELMGFLILPTIIMVPSIISWLQMRASSEPLPPDLSFIIYGSQFLIFLSTGVIMSTMLGGIIVGEEGLSVWILYSSPINARSLVKGKYAFVSIFSCIVAAICNFIGILILNPSPRFIFALFAESVSLVFALSAVSLGGGIKGADFSETPRPRMIRPLVSLINGFLCLILGSMILSPLILYGFTRILPASILPLKIDLYSAVFVSVVIAGIITFVFYRRNVKKAEELLRKGYQ
ncbi:MAG: hypothetical protein QW385_02695 [Thermoproteota archaeon]